MEIFLGIKESVAFLYPDQAILQEDLKTPYSKCKAK